MTMKTKIIILGCALLCVAATNVAKRQFQLPEAKLTVRVIDEDGNPIGGANVWLGFEERTHPGKDVAVRGLTDGEGLFTGQGGCSGVIGSEIRKEGYYLGWVHLDPFRERDSILNRWQPWDPVVTTIMRPIVNPVAMYAKRVWIELPMTDKPCGYDLIRGDWVAPYGTGEISDLIFRLDRRYVDRRDYDMSIEVRFSNENDGIQEAELPVIGRTSHYKWPREAPVDGYEPLLISKSSWKPEENFRASANDKQMYFFRVRTKLREGELSTGLYGKIRGGLLLSPLKTKTVKVLLSYYLNPSPLDRNMEWDKEKNLLKNLKYDEKPHEP